MIYLLFQAHKVITHMYSLGLKKAAAQAYSAKSGLFVISLLRMA